MRTNLLIILGMMLLASNVLAQQANSNMAKVTFSEKYAKPKASDVRQIFTLDNGNFVTVREYGEELSFALYSSDMKLLKGPKKFKFTHKQKEVGKNYFHSTQLVDNKLVIFARQKDKKNKQFNIISQVLDLEAFAIYIKPHILFTIPFSRARWENFDVTVSKNKKYFLLDYFVPTAKKGYKELAFKLYSLEGEMLWERKSGLLSKTPNLTKSFDVSSKGVSVLSVTSIIDEDDEAEARPTVFIFDKEGEILKEVELDNLKNSKIHITNLEVEFSKDDILYAVGLYLNENKRGPIGTITFSYDIANDEVSDIIKQEMPDKAVVEYQGERRTKKHYEHKKTKGSNALRNYTIKDVIANSTGYYVILEKYYYSYNSRTKKTTYFFGHILVVNYDKEHEIVWAKKIPKNQILSSGGGFSFGTTGFVNALMFAGFSAFSINDNLYFVYNDNIKNFKDIKSIKEGKMKSMTHNGYGGGTALTLAKLDANGELQLEPLFTVDTNDKLLTRPQLSVVQDNVSIIVFARRSKDFRFIKIQPK